MSRNLAGTEFKKEHKADFGREKIELLYEDEYIAVIYKPSGMLSVPYPGSRNKTAQDALENLMRKKGSYNAKHRPFVVHRLDRDTSGVMMFALTSDAQKKIMENWQKMVTERLYRAVAENSESAENLLESGTINEEIAYNAHNIGFVPKENSKPNENAISVALKARNSRNFAEGRNASGFRESRNSGDGWRNSGEKSIYERNLILKNGKAKFKTISAVTHYKILQRGKYYTFFELSLETGRKNQIRAHLASKGFPLAGDENYRAKTNPFGRLALHARTLEFVHPYTKEKMKFEIPEPEEWLLTVQNKSGKVPDLAVWAKDANFAGGAKGARNARSAKQVGNAKRVGTKKSGGAENEQIKFPSHKKISKMDFISRGKLRK